MACVCGNNNIMYLVAVESTPTRSLVCAYVRHGRAIAASDTPLASVCPWQRASERADARAAAPTQAQQTQTQTSLAPQQLRSLIQWPDEQLEQRAASDAESTLAQQRLPNALSASVLELLARSLDDADNLLPATSSGLRVQRPLRAIGFALQRVHFNFAASQPRRDDR